MKKIIVISFIFVFSSTHIFAQNSKDKKFVRQEATNFIKAYNNADIDVTLKYVYKPFLAILGIKEDGLKTYYTTLYKQYGEMGQRYDHVSLENPAKILVKDNVWQCAVPYQTTIVNETQKMRIETKASIWAISEDKGKTWRFIDLVQYDQNKIPSLLPIFDTDLQITPLEQKKL